MILSGLLHNEINEYRRIENIDAEQMLRSYIQVYKLFGTDLQKRQQKLSYSGCYKKHTHINIEHLQMEQQLQFIQDFANTIANTFKQFAQLCRVHLRKAQNTQPQFKELQNQLIEERKKRLELEEKIREKLTGATSNGQPLLPPPQERKRPKNPFTLFVADQRDKIVLQHPNWDFQKITQLAAIKWKKMSEQHKMIYQRKFQELTKLYEQQALLAKNKLGEANQNAPVKRQFREDDENHRQHADNQQQNESQNAERQIQGQENGIEPQEQNMGTLVINNDHLQQQTLNMEQEEKPKGHINQILDLFHTSANELQRDKPIEEKADSENKNLQSENRTEQVNNFSQTVNIDPSIQIIQPIVIESTVQEKQQ